VSALTLLVGGKSNGKRVAILFGDSILMEDANSGEREVYRLVTLRGGTRTFDIAVPAERVLDGDWLIERLIEGYQS